jgi:hypothetical protein
MTGEAEEVFEVDSSDVDLGDSMAETLAEIQADDEPIVEEVSDVTENDTSKRESEPEKEGRTRDESGRFAKESEQESEQVAAEPVAEIPPVELEQPAQQVDPRLERAPTTWRADAKGKWQSIDPAIRGEILKREEDIGRGIQMYKGDAEYGKAVQETLMPYMATINASGATPNQVVGSMLNTYYRLQTASPQEKAQVLMQAAHQYGADLSIMQQEYDPAQNTLQQSLYPLQQELQSLKQQLGQREQNAQQQEVNNATSTIDVFSNTLDEAGNAKYPHFETVREHMADLIDRADRSGQQMGLEEAYESALWALPEMRQTLLAQQSGSAESQRQKEAAEKATKAKKAAGTNLHGKGSYQETPNKPTGSVTDTLAETLAEINNR